MEWATNFQNVKLSKYNIFLFGIILIASQLILGILLLSTHFYDQVTPLRLIVLHLTVFVIELSALLIYEKLNARRIKSSFNKFIPTESQGCLLHIIKKNNNNDNNDNNDNDNIDNNID